MSKEELQSTLNSISESAKRLQSQAEDCRLVVDAPGLDGAWELLVNELREAAEVANAMKAHPDLMVQ